MLLPGFNKRRNCLDPSLEFLNYPHRLHDREGEFHLRTRQFDTYIQRSLTQTFSLKAFALTTSAWNTF